jgi:hypothetical protein
MATKKQGPTKESLESSEDPARCFITARVVEHPATASKAAHSTLMWPCNFCGSELAWSSWIRVRGHLCGDSILALANGATACMSASSDVKLMFKGILTAEAAKKNGAQAMKRGLEAAAKAAGSGSSSGSGSACKQQRSVQHAYEVCASLI